MPCPPSTCGCWSRCSLLASLLLLRPPASPPLLPAPLPRAAMPQLLRRRQERQRLPWMEQGLRRLLLVSAALWLLAARLFHQLALCSRLTSLPASPHG